MAIFATVFPMSIIRFTTVYHIRIKTRRKGNKIVFFNQIISTQVRLSHTTYHKQALKSITFFLIYAPFAAITTSQLYTYHNISYQFNNSLNSYYNIYDSSYYIKGGISHRKSLSSKHLYKKDIRSSLNLIFRPKQACTPTAFISIIKSSTSS